MKVYVHYEKEDRSSADAYTKIMVLKEGLSTREVVSAFILEYGSIFSHNELQESSLCLMTEDDEALTSFSGVIDRADLFIRRRPKGFKEPAAKKTTVLAPPLPHPSAKVTLPTGDDEATISKLLSLYKDKKYALAMQGCEEIVGLNQKISTRLKGHALTMLADMNLHANHLNKARSYAQQNLKLYRTDPEAVLLLARVMVEQEDHDEAFDLLEELMATKHRVLKAADGEDKVLRAAALMGDCLMALGRGMEAADVLNNHLSMPGADSNSSLLATYAELALRHDKVEEGIRALLKAIVLEQNDKRIRNLFAAAVQGEQGAEEVLRQIPSKPQSASAIAFLATIAKDGSALKSAAQFYRAALKMAPDSASYALNLIHILEAMDLPEEAMAETRNFLKKNASRRFGPHGNCCTCGDFNDVLTTYDKAMDNDAYLQMDVDVDSDRNVVRIVRVNGDGATEVMPEPSHTLDDATLDLLAIGFTAVKVLYSMGDLTCLPKLFELLEPSRASSVKSLHETSIRNEHAYYQCIAWVLAARADNAEKYYTGLGDEGCSQISDIRLLACSNPLACPAFNCAASRPIYVCGDSHTVSLAWGILDTPTGPRLLIPKLVTGVKHWHLRQDSRFYPKTNFFNVVRSIPAGADTIFILGEIDCREGILVAVERGKYQTVDDGIKHTVQIFGKIVERLVKEKQFNVAVHPIPPVLNETRPLVMRYSEVYETEMNKLRGTVYLDFQMDLIDDSGGFKKELQLDGTHIHPSYISFLQREYVKTAK